MIGFNAVKRHRRSIRLTGYDYSQIGAYFITLCTQNRQCLFGDVTDGQMRLNGFGEIVCHAWDGLPNHYPHVELDAFIVMPNHVHTIIVLNNAVVGAGLKPALARHSLSEIVRAFKTFSARHINKSRGTQGTAVWQRNYYEHIIRNDTELYSIRNYIATNPSNWAEDRENPDNNN